MRFRLQYLLIALVMMLTMPVCGFGKEEAQRVNIRIGVFDFASLQESLPGFLCAKRLYESNMQDILDEMNDIRKDVSSKSEDRFDQHALADRINLLNVQYGQLAIGRDDLRAKLYKPIQRIAQESGVDLLLDENSIVYASSFVRPSFFNLTQDIREKIGTK